MRRRIVHFSLTLFMTAWLAVLIPAHQSFSFLCAADTGNGFTGSTDSIASTAAGQDDHSSNHRHAHDDAKCVLCLQAAGLSHAPIAASAAPSHELIEITAEVPADLPVLQAPTPVYQGRGPPSLV